MNRNQDTENQKNQNRSGSCSFWQISSGLSIQIGSDVVFSHVFSGLGCLLGLEILSDTGEKAQWKQKRRFPADVSNEFHQGLFTSSHTLPMKGRRMRKKVNISEYITTSSTFWYIHSFNGVVLFGRGSCDATLYDIARDGRVSAWFGAPRFMHFKQPHVFNAVPRVCLNAEAH